MKRTESVERTWGWMNAGEIDLGHGPEVITLKLLEKSKNEAGLIKALRFSRK